jgi:hypothetical protein
MERVMTTPDRRRAYLAGLAKAHAELDEILATLKQLQVREESLVGAAQALEGLFETAKQAGHSDRPAACSPVEPLIAMSGPVPCQFELSAEPSRLLEHLIPVKSSDPIQRRINDALGTEAVA